MPKKKADDVEEVETESTESEVEESAETEAVEHVETDPETEKDPVEEAAEEVPAEETAPEAEAEKADDSPVVKVGGRTVRARGFFGSYKNVRFVNDESDEWGVAKRVSDATLELLRSDFPKLEIEVLD